MKKSFKVLMVVMFLVYSLTLVACDFNALLDKLPFDIPFLEEKEEYTITYYVDGEVYFEINIEEGKDIKLPSDPYKDGYEFKGWVTGSGEEVYDGLIVDGNLSLYANFREMNESEEWIYVYFFVDGVIYEEQKIQKGTNIKSYGVPFKDGYEFDYWMYKDGSRFYNLDKLYEDTSLYAVFKEVNNKEEYVIVNFYVDGKLEKAQEFIRYNLFENIFTPYKEGHTFSHWQDKYGIIYDTATPLTENVDLYAVFNKIDESVTCEVTYFVDALIYDKQTYSMYQTLKLPIEPHKSGYKFIGWYAGGMQYCEGDKVTGSVKLNAMFEKSEDDSKYINITYYVDGKVDKTQQILLSSSITDRYTPYKEGYKFKYWADIYGNEFNFNEKLYKDVYLYAVFEEDINEYNGFTYNEYTDYIEITRYIGNEKSVCVPGQINEKNVTMISNYAFKDCTFEEIDFSNLSVTRYVSKGLFNGCYNLKNITANYYSYDQGYIQFYELFTTDIKEMVNYNFKIVTLINIPTMLDTPFIGCNIEQIIAKDYIGMVMDGVFTGINNLKTIIIDNPSYVSNNAFMNIENVNIYFVNNSLADKTFNYSDTNKVYLYSETEPTTSGNYWHYVDGEIVVWGEKLCTITYIVDGNVYLVEQKNVGDYLNCPINVEKTGYEFKGWYDENDRYYYGGDYVVSNYTLYAKFEPVVSASYFLADSSYYPLYEYEFKYENGIYSLDTYLNSGMAFVIYDSVNDRYIGEYDFVASEGLDRWTSSVCTNVSGNFRIEVRNGKVYVSTPESSERKNYSYTEYEDYIVIDKCLYTESYLTIPSYINMKPVTIIGSYAFSGKDISYLTIPNTVVEIREYAFSGCSNITNLYLSENLEIIGEYAFNGLRSLTRLSLYSKLKEIRRCAFSVCTNLKSLVIPKSVTYVDQSIVGAGTITLYFEHEDYSDVFDKPGYIEAYSYRASKPTTEGNYWYLYNDHSPVIWNINASGYYLVYANIPECKEQNKLTLNSDGSYSINIYINSNEFFTVYNVESKYFFHSGTVASYEGIFFGTSGIYASYSGNYQIKLINDLMYIYYLG